LVLQGSTACELHLLKVVDGGEMLIDEHRIGEWPQVLILCFILDLSSWDRSLKNSHFAVDRTAKQAGALSSGSKETCTKQA
jgi:hypothetical protein